MGSAASPESLQEFFVWLVNEGSPEMLRGGEGAEGEKAKEENEGEVSEPLGR